MKFRIICIYILIFAVRSQNIAQVKDSLIAGNDLRIFTERNHPEFGELAYTYCDYKNNKKNGKCTVKNAKGEVLAEISYSDDKKNGLAGLYYKKRLKELALFENDRLIMRQIYSGNKIFKTEYYAVVADSSVMKEQFLYRWGGRKWIYRYYEGPDLKKEISYNKQGKIKFTREYDSNNVKGITK